MEQNVYLIHHGIKGQRWGVRRYQNENGSLTPKGRKHYERLSKNYRGSRNYYESKAALDNRTALPAAIVGGAAAAIGVAMTFPVSAAWGAGIAGGAVLYGAWKGQEAIDRAIADRADRKLSEVEAKLNGQ